MLLSVFYMAATMLQSFRLRSFVSRIARQLNERVSTVFYTLPDTICDTPEAAASSDLCANRRESRMVDILWQNGAHRGCIIEPSQTICINTWITFPTTPLNIPIKMNDTRYEAPVPDSIYMLVEAQFPLESTEQGSSGRSREQFMGFTDYSNTLFVEEFGTPLAWRVDSHFAFLLRTDKERLLQFIVGSFIAGNLSINNDLQLLRIQSVDVEGEAQPFESIRQHSKKDVFAIEPRILGNPELRQKYMSLLNGLCYLAHQADEFNAEKSRKGRPDLIASNCVNTDQSSPPEPLINEVPVDKKKNILKRTKRSEGSFISAGKPPNILVYSESSVTRDNVMMALKNVLKADTYTVYPLTPTDVKSRIWQDNTRLLVVCGSISQGISPLLLEFYLNQSGNMLCLCSDLLHVLLPTYRTAEVREQELAQFTYNRWQKVALMHHVFCYQPSPIKKHFSRDSEDNPNGPNPKLVCPKSVEVADAQGRKHSVNVDVLGVEETWRTPSILLATNPANNGRAVFSQVHLEADPSQFEGDEGKYEALQNSNKERLEILSDLLATHLSVEVRLDFGQLEVEYSSGYFLGDDEDRKKEFLRRIESQLDVTGCLSSGAMNLTWVEGEQTIPKATERFLPISVDKKPKGFDAGKYFETLVTKKLGRLVIYVPIVTSSMDVMDKLSLDHGLVVIPKYQSNGSGRSKNKWLSADGCLMFTIQLKISLGSVIGQRLPLVQHLMATAVVNAILSEEGYQDLDIRIKWPNDMYANGTIKIGGLIVTTTIEGADAVCNVGVGLNLDNGSPTICINDLIRDFNSANPDGELRTFDPEIMFAKIFNELEQSLDDIERKQSLDDFYRLYYQLWLHQDQQVQVQDHVGVIKSGIVSGIDEYGYLKVAVDGGQELSVHPDGNSFDMLRGLILPKFN